MADDELADRTRAARGGKSDGERPPAVARAHAIGAWALITLGVGHGSGMLVDTVSPTFFMPTDPAVLAEMRVTPVDLGALLGGARMTVWRGHVGWNLSIALGFAFLGALQLLYRRADPQGGVTVPLLRVAVVASATWAVIASLFWFWVPCAGFTIATLAFGYVLAKTPRATVPPPAAPTVADRLPNRLLRLGALPMGFAGLAHLLAVFPELFTHGAFSPTTASLRRSMEQTGLALPAMFGRPTTMWGAYTGFNFAHGVAVTAFAASAFLVAGALRPSPEARSVRALFAAASVSWAAIAASCWFWMPLTVTLVASAAHVAALVVGRAGERDA